MERAKRFYGETLGLPENEHPEQGFPEYQLGENVSLYLLQMENIGQTFTAPHSGSIALRVAGRRRGAEGARGEGDHVRVRREPFDTGVCHMAIFTDPDGNQLMLHHRYAPYES